MVPSNALWALVCGGIVGLVHGLRRGALVGALVISRLVLDWVTGRLELWPGEPVVGFDLYEHPRLDFLFEAVLIGGGWLVYRTSLPAAGRKTGPTYAILATLFVAQPIFFLVFFSS